MKRNRFWLEIVTLGAMGSLIFAIGIATLIAGAALAFAAGPQAHAEKYQASAAQTFSGVITDSICGAKHDTSMNQSAARCTKVCLARGGKYALVNGDKLYVLEGGTEYLDRSAGERVTVTGDLVGDTIKVTAVSGGR
jgi:hypothetical protein